MLEALRLELTDCAFPLLDELKFCDDPAEAFAGADWIILLASKQPRLPTMSRLDMLRASGPIYIEHGRAINHAAASA